MKIVEVPQLQSISKPSSPPMLKHALHFCVETTWPAVLCAVHRPRLASALRSSVLGKPWMPWSMLSEHTCFFCRKLCHQHPSTSIKIHQMIRLLLVSSPKCWWTPARRDKRRSSIASAGNKGFSVLWMEWQILGSTKLSPRLEGQKWRHPEFYYIILYI